MKKVLLVDDDVELTGMLAQYLRREHFDVDLTHDPEMGVRRALREDYALVVLDVMMPGLSGVEVLRRIRAASHVPVLMLTARAENVDRIVGLDMGADDYVPKPCSSAELLARIRAILRRTQASSGAGMPALAAEVVASGPLTMWPARRQAHWQDRPLALTGTEYALLLELARYAGQLVSKAELSLHALGRALEPFDRRIDVHLSSVRQKLGQRSDGRPWIQSTRGQGYQLLVD